ERRPEEEQRAGSTRPEGTKTHEEPPASLMSRPRHRTHSNRVRSHPAIASTSACLPNSYGAEPPPTPIRPWRGLRGERLQRRVRRLFTPTPIQSRRANSTAEVCLPKPP